ncbi:MAG TPA: hypothetical protein VFH80_16430 [Solirubrobacteraceae bacterium]|nr:hypothetical protein [Solirubrobacteraceae bacterium]
MNLNRLGVAWARSAHASASDEFSIGGLVFGDQTSADGVIGLIETLAYIGDVLSSQQDQVAAEGILTTTYDDERDVLHIDLRADARPIVCVVVDDCRAFVVSIGANAGEATVSFGDGSDGRRPPPGFENVRARYRDGDGDGGNVEVTGLRLGRAFAVVAVRRGSWSFVRCGGE